MCGEDRAFVEDEEVVDAPVQSRISSCTKMWGGFLIAIVAAIGVAVAITV